jgi:signal transduction histidine kinase
MDTPDLHSSPVPMDAEQALALGIAGLAHDLRAPLATIHTATELLARDLDQLDPAAIRQMAQTIQRGTRRLEQLTDNLHSFLALRSGQLAVNPAPLDLRVLLDECADSVGPLLAAKAQQWATHQATPVPLVLADRQLIDRVCMNLLTNASKFAAPGNLIEGVVSPAGDYVRVAIQDRGPGLPPGDTARLFEPFYQAPDPTTRGVGLGLAIVRAIVEAHAGQVGADNRRGGGARVWFALPVVRA